MKRFIKWVLSFLSEDKEADQQVEIMLKKIESDNKYRIVEIQYPDKLGYQIERYDNYDTYWMRVSTEEIPTLQQAKKEIEELRQSEMYRLNTKRKVIDL